MTDDDEIRFCESCGSQTSRSAAYCSRCGARMTYAGATPSAAEQATTQLRTSPLGESAASPDRADAAPRTTMPPGPAARLPSPSEAWVVAALLAAMAVLLSVPFFSVFADSVGDAFTGDGLLRAFALLGLIVAVTLFAISAGLLFLAVGVLRGRRPSQLLTCFVAALIAVVELATYRDLRDGGARPNTAELVLLVLGCFAAIAALTVRPRVRAFYGADDRPLAASVAAAANAYVGFATTLNGLVLSLCGPVAQKFAVLGLLMSITGLLLFLSTWLMLGGNVVARVLALLADAGAIACFFVLGHFAGSVTLPSTLIPAGLAVLGAGACLIALNGTATRGTAATPLASRRRAGTPLVTAVLLVVAALCAASAGYGLDKAPPGGRTEAYTSGGEDPSNNPSDYPSGYPSDDPQTGYAGETDPPVGSTDLTTDARSWTVDEELSDGTTATATISVGVPQPMSAGLYNGSFEAGSGCSLTDASDAVVPFSISVTTDDSSDEYVGLQLGGIGSSSLPDISGSVMTFEAEFSDDGTVCNGDDSSDTFGVQTSTADGSTSVDGFLDISDYYSSDSAQSDIDSEATLTIAADQSLDYASSTVTGVSSPSVDNGGSWTINVLGS